MENSEVVLFLASIIILFCIYFFTPYGINKHIIKKRLLRQKRTIQSQNPNKLLSAEHVFGIEWAYLFSMLLVAAPFIIGILSHIPDDSVKEMICQVPFHIKESSVNLVVLLLAYYVPALLLFILLNLISLYVRKALGKIQGAVLFDPKEKKVYVFPSIDSDNYKEYHESELAYTTESYASGSRNCSTTYVFFTKKDNDFAFKVDNLEYNNFGVFLSLREDDDISIPFKYRFHTFINFIIALTIFLFGMIVILPLVR